jgi:hypothetical protein
MVCAFATMSIRDEGPSAFSNAMPCRGQVGVSGRACVGAGGLAARGRSWANFYPPPLPFLDVGLSVPAPACSLAAGSLPEGQSGYVALALVGMFHPPLLCCAVERLLSFVACGFANGVCFQDWGSFACVHACVLGAHASPMRGKPCVLCTCQALVWEGVGAPWNDRISPSVSINWSRCALLASLLWTGSEGVRSPRVARGGVGDACGAHVWCLYLRGARRCRSRGGQSHVPARRWPIPAESLPLPGKRKPPPAVAPLTSFRGSERGQLLMCRVRVCVRQCLCV